MDRFFLNPHVEAVFFPPALLDIIPVGHPYVEMISDSFIPFDGIICALLFLVPHAELPYFRDNLSSAPQEFSALFFGRRRPLFIPLPPPLLIPIFRFPELFFTQGETRLPPIAYRFPCSLIHPDGHARLTSPARLFVLRHSRQARFRALFLVARQGPFLIRKFTKADPYLRLSDRFRT